MICKDTDICKRCKHLIERWGQPIAWDDPSMMCRIEPSKINQPLGIFDFQGVRPPPDCSFVMEHLVLAGKYNHAHV